MPWFSAAHYCGARFWLALWRIMPMVGNRKIPTFSSTTNGVKLSTAALRRYGESSPSVGVSFIPTPEERGERAGMDDEAPALKLPDEKRT